MKNGKLKGRQVCKEAGKMSTEARNYLMAQEMYNELHLYEGDKNDTPFWKLTDREVKYYEWLFSKDEYSELRKKVAGKIK
jgi:hypothetical protein